MIRVLLLLLTIIFSVAWITYLENPSFVKNLYTLTLTSPKAWGKIYVEEEKKIDSLKDVFKSELVWQILEQLVGFVTGVLICVLIGWRVSSYRNFYEKSFENSLTECIQRQNKFEKQLSAIELQIVNFERTYLFAKEETLLKSNDAEAATPSEEVDEGINKVSHNTTNEGIVHRAVEAIMKQDFDESNFECTLEKLTKILERLSKLSKEKILLTLDSNTVLEQERDPVIEEAQVQEYSEKGSVEVETIGDITGAVNRVINEEEEKNATFPEERESDDYLPSDISCDNCLYEMNPPDINCEDSSYQLQTIKSNEKLSNSMILNEGAGECGEIYQGKIVTISQIPQYFELRKKIKQRNAKGYDDEKLSFMSARNTPEQSISERSTPQTTPRKNISAPIETKADSAIKGRRKKPARS